MASGIRSIHSLKKLFRLSQTSYIDSLRYRRPGDGVTAKLVPMANMPQPVTPRPNVPIMDSLFAHVPPGTKYFNWDRNIAGYRYAIFTDTSVHQSVRYPRHAKIAWMLESPEVTVDSYKWFNANIDKFQYVFTFKRDLLEQYPDKCRFAPASSCWIEPADMGMHGKSKLVSIIASNKKFASGHNLRFDVINRLRTRMDVYGRGWNEIKNKADGLKDYMFSVAIENNKSDYYFTEKLLDCFATGTIPIYYGCPSIGDIFNPDGIIMVNGVDDIDKVLSELTPELYQRMLPAARENFELLQRFISCDDYLYANHKEILLGENMNPVSSPLNDVAKEVYVINLDRRADRWVDMKQELDKHGIVATRWSAVDGKTIQGSHHMYHGDMPGEKIKGAVGALRSHRSVIADAQKKNHDVICVMEDDLILQPNFNDRFVDLINKVPANWDMLYLGCHWHGLPQPLNLGNGIYKLRCFGVFGVLVKRTAYQLILDATKGEEIPMDDYFVRTIHPKLNVYTTIPFLVKVKPDFSDIAGKFAEYNIISQYFY